MTTAEEALTIAIQHHQAGRLRAAEQIYRQVLSVDAKNADALHLLGVMASQAGQHEVAAGYIRQAIALNGRVAAYYNNLGVVYNNLGKRDEAASCYRRAISLQADYADPYSNLGVIYKMEGKLDDASACYCRAIALKPQNAEFHSNLGVVYREQGKLEAAIACQRRAVELKPDSADAHNNLGVALKEHGKLDEAIASFRRAMAVRPAFADVYSNLGNALKEQGKLDDAVACYRRALELRPEYAEAYGNLGAALIEQGKAVDAEAACRRALELKPDYVEAHLNLASALVEQGKLEQAIAGYRRVLELRPACAEAHYSLGIVREMMGDMAAAADCYRAATRHRGAMAPAQYKLATLLGGRLSEEEVSAQHRLLQRKDLTDEQRMYLHFGLAYVYDGRGEYAEAAQHLERGNSLQLSWWRSHGRVYDPIEQSAVIDRLIEICTPDFFRRTEGFGLPDETPVFVFGLPRSGTTLVEQILAAHSAVCGAGEIHLASETMNALASDTFNPLEGLARLDRETARRVASQHLEKLQSLAPAAKRIVDKSPDNYMLLGPLACLFPRAKFILCRRDLRDTAVSCWMTHFKEVRWANDVQYIASRFRAYLRVTEYWRKVLPVPLLEVDYEETVTDLESAARKLVAWCGLPWEPACLDFHLAKRPVGTASSVQVRRPVYTTSVGRWRHYEQPLATLLSQIPGGK